LDQKTNIPNYQPTKDERNQENKVCHSKNFFSNEYSHARGVEVKTKAATAFTPLARAPELLAVDTQMRQSHGSPVWQARNISLILILNKYSR
jgi:hypothetical protein